MIDKIIWERKQKKIREKQKSNDIQLTTQIIKSNRKLLLHSYKQNRNERIWKTVHYHKSNEAHKIKHQKLNRSTSANNSLTTRTK